MNDNSPVQQIRDEAKELSTEQLIKAVREIEDARPTTDEQSVRIVYSVMCAEACRRLGLDPKETAESLIGPAAVFEASTL